MSHLESLDRIYVIIPALNEAATIGQVVETLKTQGLHRICVVDNGSDDRTAEIAIQAQAHVICEPKQGYGQACWRGVQTLDDTVDWILFCDGDGSDDLDQLPEFLALRHDYDLILGNRRGTQAGRRQLTPAQNFGNGLATTLIQWGWHHRYQDLGPLRLIRRRALEQIEMGDRSYGWTVEMQTRAIECGLRICEIPVRYHSRQGGQSKITGTLKGMILAGFCILSTLLILYGKRWHYRLSSPRWQRGLQGLSAIFLVIGSLWTIPHGDFRQADAVPQFWMGIAIMSLGFVLSWPLNTVGKYWFWGIAITTRLLLLGMYPGDDIWRYLWEGYIQTAGFSPYAQAPNAEILSALRTDWWSNINHIEISAIYPPITQLGFRILAQVNLSVIVFKGMFTLADLGICSLLSRRFGYSQTLLYAWNPLVIYSFAGGGHYDSWFLLPLVGAWLWFQRFQSQLVFQALGSAFLLGISIAVKWISAPILCFLAWRLVQRKRWGISLSVLGVGCLPIMFSALPFCTVQSCPLIPFGSSFVTEGRSAAFIPHLVSLVWAASRWENWLYAIPLGLFISVWIMRWSKAGPNASRSFQKFSEGYLIALLVLSPVVHAWYFCWLVPFAVASRNLGTRLVSLSVFIYFALPHHLANGGTHWLLNDTQRAFLWLPFLLGLVYWIRVPTENVQAVLSPTSDL